MLSSLKLGFLGAGSLACNMIEAYLNYAQIPPRNIFLSSRNLKKREKTAEKFKITGLSHNESLLEQSQVIFLCVKPYDLPELLEQLESQWFKEHTVLSPVAGMSFKRLQKLGLNSKRLVRFMPNTNVCVGKGLLPFCSLNNQENLNSFVEKILEPLGLVFALKEERLLEPLTVACASGSSFILEIMQYWQEWLVGESFSEEKAKTLVLQTFLGTSIMAEKRQNKSFAELQKEITSKKGVSEEGLKHMRELELERLLRWSFEQAAMKLKQIASS